MWAISWSGRVGTDQRGTPKIGRLAKARAGSTTVLVQLTNA